MLFDRNDKTICAISTPHGHGGIAVIRVSGKNSLDICKKIIPRFRTDKPLSHKVYLSSIVDDFNHKVDEALVTFFEQGKSFTGEEVLEISCHGSTFISQKIIDLLIQNGCFLAEKGEFTFRAFINNKIDLIQAESVLSLIQSQSEMSAKIALRQLEGKTSEKFLKIESDLTWCLAHIEASIDFSSENIDIIDNNVLIEKLTFIEKELNFLIDSYKSGHIIKDGIKIVFFGPPNAGKSSLLNNISREEKAIVTSFAGTTRDIIETKVIHKGISFSLSDTAGIRSSSDLVETIGIKKTITEASKSDVLCFVLPVDEKNLWKSIIAQAPNQSTRKIFLLNKSDLISDSEKYELLNHFFQLVEENTNQVFFTNHNQVDLREIILDKSLDLMGNLDFLSDSVISSSRQLEGAQYATKMLSASISELKNNLGSEFIAMFLKDALVSLQKVLGKSYDDQILDRVFKEFCLGK